MNLESLYHKINRPDTLDAPDLPALKDLCAKYPYAQLFSVLYLKALAQSKNLHFEDELQNHAYKITDRAKLYELIHAQQGEMIETSTEPVNPQHEEAIEISAAQVNPQHDADQQLLQPEASNPIADQAEISEAPPVEQPAANIREIDELEKEILSGVMANAYSLELEERQNQENKKEEEAAKPQHVASQHASQGDKADLNKNRSFTSWLKLASHEEEQKKPEKEADQLIEKFIRHEPERMKPKTEFYSAPKKAKESVSDEKLVYTETLANIYALQGNYPKAITAFQQLMLTIPEKKLYFAQKIEELNKKINP